MSLNLRTATASMYNCFDKDSQGLLDANVNDDHSVEDSNKFGANLNNDGSNTEINNFNNGLEDDKNSSQNIKDNLSNNVNGKLNAVGNQVAISLHNHRDISEDPSKRTTTSPRCQARNNRSEAGVGSVKDVGERLVRFTTTGG